jgi:SHS2 domain-containing protein
MHQFAFLEDVAVADAAFEATGDSPSELFVGAAEAVIETMVDRQTVSGKLERAIERQDEDLGALLFDWLSDIVYLKDAEGLVFREATATVDGPRDGKWRLRGRVTGETINPARHELRADVKAVTKHLYEVGQKNGRWHARVVLDI